MADETQVRAAGVRSNGSDLNIWFWQDDRLPQIRGTNIVWAIFEIEKLPYRYTEWLKRNAQVVWVPSRWGKEVLTANGIRDDLIDVIPEGVAPEAFHPHLRVMLDKSGQPFRFLMLGKYERRKSYEEALDAFAAAFGGSNDVELVVKADYFVDSEGTKKRALSELVSSRNLANVRLLWGNWSTRDLLGLYSTCDAFIFPSKAEGWGLPLIEAAASGMPVISTLCSGHAHFLEHIESSLLKVDFALEPIDDAEMHKYWPSVDRDLGRWATPSVDSIGRCMRMTRENYPHYLSEAWKNGLLLRERFSWSAAADKAIVALSNRGLLGRDLKVSMP